MKRSLPVLALFGLALALGLAGCPKPPPSTPPAPEKPATGPVGFTKGLVVFAGAAGKPALEELAERYQEQKKVKIDMTFGGSGSVLKQFSQEKFGDVYIPGSDDFMDKAEKQQAVLADTRKALVDLVPVICVAKGNPKQITKLEDFGRTDLRVVIGEPKSVCLGAIAQEVLEKQSLWTKVQPKIASYATSCEDVLNNLLLGEADVVLGWDVFARQQPDKVEAIALPAGLTKSRNIPAAVIQWSTQAEDAKAFIAFLADPANADVWKEKGYTVAQAAAVQKP